MLDTHIKSSLNLFSYCNNTPVVSIDSYGTHFCSSTLVNMTDGGDGGIKRVSRDYIIYYNNANSNSNLDEVALNNSYSKNAVYTPVGSFDELACALKEVPCNTNNIYLYLHGYDGGLAFYYNQNYTTTDILSEIPEISINGAIYLFACDGATIAPAFSSATGQEVIACYQCVSFHLGYAHADFTELTSAILHGEPSLGWQTYFPDGTSVYYDWLVVWN